MGATVGGHFSQRHSYHRIGGFLLGPRHGGGRALYAVAYWATLLGFLGIYCRVHQLADLTFPVPWPDEGSFLWQAIAVQEGNTLFAPQLNPHRHLMWMPPGYMILSGLVFKLTGFSLALARALSALYVMCGMLLLVRILGRYRYPFLYLILSGCFLLGRDLVLAGNFARMEGLIFLMATAGFALLQRGHNYKGLFLIFLSPLVHPNGLYFCAGAAAYVSIAWWRHPERRRLSWSDAATMLLVSASWTAYAIYVAAHWPDFASDMAYQVSWRESFADEAVGFWDRVISRDTLILCAAGGAVIAYGVKRRIEASFLLAIAIPLGLLNISSTGFMYGIYASLLVLLASVILIEMGMRLVSDWSRGRARAWSAVLGAAVFLIAGALVHGAGRLESPLDYPYRMTRDGMRMAGAVPYYTAEDAEGVRRFLRSLELSDSPVEVQFLPWADALLFRDLEREGFRLVQPTFHDGKADVHIVHLSRYVPTRLKRMTRLRIAFQSGIHSKLANWPVLQQRDGTEKWLVHLAGVGDS